MIAMRGAPIWPNAGAIRPRTRVARWVAEHGAARLWVLQAGPGAGKRATASLLAAAFGGPVFGFEATGDRPLASLTDDLGLPGDTAPERVAEALLARAAADWREGGVLVVRAADPGALANPTATAFARRWIASPPRGSIRTIVTTRWAIPWLPPRLVASGEAVVLGAPDLWFDTGEAADLLGDREVAAETLAATCGWPLAVASLARLAGKPGLRAFLEDLAAAELLDALPPDLRSAVAWLGPVPNWRSGDVPLDDPDLGRALERLIGWGLLVPGPAGEVAWHPLARPALNRLAGAGVAPADREARFRLMGEWLEARQPGRALDYWLAHGATAEAVACVARHGTSVPPSAARDREVAGLLERLPREVREADPHVLLAEGSLLLRRGSLGGAYDRLAAARRRFSATGAPAGEFASLARLLGVCLQRQAVAEGRAIAAAADDLAQQADLAELVVYRVNRGSLEFLAGDEEAALRAYRLALDVPHLGRKRAGLAQQEACLNVAILAQERGEYGQARRALLRALDLHADFPVDPSLPRRALLQIAMVLLAAGDREEGAAALERAGQAPAPEDGYHAALCGMLEGNALARLGKPEAAEASLRATLDALHRLGLDQSPDAAAALVVMADLSRQAGRPDAARLQLEWAEPLVGGLPRLRARLLHGRALLARAAGDLAAGR
ncbi:MAG: hypothetical protein FJZ01_23030, partial [Candidatus Sericytochromatia bacterium]|nr:hypothetical protein [Candidatus Tanganyikabacteria bacterium]